jgi:hypothetical protein
MEVTTRIKSRLTEVTEWNGVIDEFESQASSAGTPQAQSAAFFQLAQACEGIFLDKAKAMTFYQTAVKRDRENLFALQQARSIYQQMANLEMVIKLMALELRANKDPNRAPALNYAYGRALLNLRQVDNARPTSRPPPAPRDATRSTRTASRRPCTTAATGSSRCRTFTTSSPR